jgi:hypothetical protein
VVTLFAAKRLRWGSKTLVLALLASVPPGFTLVFEAWAERTGRLHRRASRTAASTAGTTASRTSTPETREV